MGDTSFGDTSVGETTVGVLGDTSVGDTAVGGTSVRETSKGGTVVLTGAGKQDLSVWREGEGHYKQCLITRSHNVKNVWRKKIKCKKKC